MEMKNVTRRAARWGVSLICLPALLVFSTGSTVSAQDYDRQPGAPRVGVTQLLSPEQMDSLIAPIALYPDPLLSQVLAASTYPLEVVEAQQWLQQYGNLRGEELVDAAKQQNWDPSVQALVVFPEVLRTLNRDVRWTTDLGNAFLAQQQDVMDAVQRMRQRAQQNGRLATTAQQTVRYETENGQRAVVILPADPQVIYVPVYSPEYVWGAPSYWGYRDMWYPGFGGGFAFGNGIYLGGFFPSWGYGWSGWNAGWGWGCDWFGGGLFVNRPFFSNYGYRGYYDGGHFLAGGRGEWQHDPYHRSGISYADRGVASRFNNSRFAEGRYNGMYSSGGYGGGRGMSGSNAPSGRGFASSPRGGFNGGGQSQGYGRNSGQNNNNAGQSYRGNSGSGFSSGSRGYSAPQSDNGGSRGFSAPQNYGGASRNSAPQNSSGTARGYSAPQNYGGSRGYSAPQNDNGGSRGFSSPQNYGGASRNYSAPQNSGGASRGFSAPQNYGGSSRSYSAPSSGSQGGFSGGGRPSSGGGRGFSGGGGGGGGGSSPSFSGRSSGGGGGGGGRSSGGGGRGGGHR